MNTLRLMRFGLLVGVTEFKLFWNWKTWFGGWILLAMLAMDRMANAGRKDGTIELV